MLLSKSRLGDPADACNQQVDKAQTNSAPTDAIGQPFVEIVGGAHVHLPDLVLGVHQLLLQPFLRHADVAQQRLHLAQLRLDGSRTCRGRCIQLLRGQRRKAAQLVEPAANMSPEQRRNKLQRTARDCSAAADMRRAALTPNL